MTKQQIISLIRRKLGEPVVKVELDNSQIEDHIAEARKKWIKWAVGNATQEVWFTIMLSGGQYLYDLPTGVVEVINYDIDAMGLGKVNTLFTVDNYLYSQGYYQGLLSSNYYGYSMLDYHIARGFLETVARYIPDEYNFKYHRYTNQLEIQPVPQCGNSLVIPERTDCNGNTIAAATYDSPGFILLHTYMINGSTLPGYDATDNLDDFYGEDWVIDYSYYLSMHHLGRIRNKFAQFASLGNTGISLDGDSLISIADQNLERLEETLRKEEAHDGYPILIG